MAGRKSLKDELGIIRRYADLSEPYFRVLKKKLESDVDPAAQMWAVEQLSKAFVKMIPQTLDGMGENGALVIQWLQSPSPTNQENGKPDSITPEGVGLSSSSTDEQEKQQPFSTTSNETPS